eukprot:SAG22_NODE_14379_length_376_cov_0.563177_1_plen_78_part_10
MSALLLNPCSASRPFIFSRPSLLCLAFLGLNKKLPLRASANGAYMMEAKSDQVHTIWQTPSFGMGAVVFSPNDYFSPN